jgi:hypothetical protein
MEKKYYSVKVDSLVPTTLEYKVLADDPEDAINEAKKRVHKPDNIQYRLPERKDKQVSVYTWGTFMLHIKRTLVGILR